jgi:RHS repeat-associated protein
MNHFVRFAFLGLALAAQISSGASLTRTSAFEYDPTTGFVTKEIIEPDNSTLCLVNVYSYDPYGNRTGVITRNCNGSSSEAPAPTGDPVFTSRTSASTYASGSVLINGATYSWSAGQFPTTTTNALYQSEARTFDPRFGGAASLTGPNGLITSWTFDNFGRKASENRADTTVTTWTFTQCVNSPGTCPTYGVYFIAVSTTGAPQSRTFLDSLERTIRTETRGFDGTWVRTDTQYDSFGRVTQVSKPYKASDTAVWTAYQYDNLNRVIEVDEPAVNGNVLRIATTYNGLVVTVTTSNAGTGTNMPAGAVQTRMATKNSQGQIINIADTQGNPIAYLYDPFGNVLSTTAASVVTSAVYDLRGRKTSATDPDLGNWSYYYDALGQLIRQRDAKGQIVSLTSDVLGRMTSRTEADLVSTWTYDTCTMGVGKLCSVSATDGYSRTHSYDSLGRPSTTSISVDTTYNLSTTYDTSGRLDTLTYPTGFAVKNIYNGYGYLSQVQHTNDPDTTVYWTATAVNAAGQVTSELLGNGITTTRSYDALFRMTAVASTGSGGTIHNLAYQLDTVSNVIQRQDLTQSVTENFAYDSLNRLLSASGTGLTTRSYIYDATGNVTYKSDVGTYTYPTSGQMHAVTNVSGGGAANTVTATYGYDANGNLTSASGTIYASSSSVAFSRTLAYMSFNMPSTFTQVQGSSTYSYTYTYNAEHERVKLVTVRPDDTFTTVYVHPNGKGELIYEKQIRQSDGRIEHMHYVNGGAGIVGVFVSKTIYGPGEGPEMRYYHRDNVGSAVVITNPAATVIERLAFEPYGERRYPSGAAEDRSSPLIGITTERGFTLHEHLDEMMLIHMNGRIYDPILARFMTPDPFVQGAFNLQSYNRYSYAWANPLRYSDPSGYDLVDDFINDVGNIAGDILNASFDLTGIRQLGHAVSSTWKSAWNGDIGKVAVTVSFAYYTGGLASDWHAVSDVADAVGDSLRLTGRLAMAQLGFDKSVLRFVLIRAPEKATEVSFRVFHAMPGQSIIDDAVIRNPLLYDAGEMVSAYFTAFCGGCGAMAWAAYYNYQVTGSMSDTYRQVFTPSNVITVVASVYCGGYCQNWQMQLALSATKTAGNIALHSGNCREFAKCTIADYSSYQVSQLIDPYAKALCGGDTSCVRVTTNLVGDEFSAWFGARLNGQTVDRVLFQSALTQGSFDGTSDWLGGTEWAQDIQNKYGPH